MRKSCKPAMSRRLLTSYHEAAHAVIRTELGLPFEKIEVYDPPAPDADGYLTTLPNFPLDSPELGYAAVVSTLASIPTELWLLPGYQCKPRKRQPRSQFGVAKLMLIGLGPCMNDWADAEQLAEIFGIPIGQALDDSFSRVYEKWDTIVRVAEVLNAKGEMNQAEVRNLWSPEMLTTSSNVEVWA